MPYGLDGGELHGLQQLVGQRRSRELCIVADQHWRHQFPGRYRWQWSVHQCNVRQRCHRRPAPRPGGNVLVNGTGTPIAGVTTDYDGDLRSLTAPVIGF